MPPKRNTKQNNKRPRQETEEPEVILQQKTKKVNAAQTRQKAAQPADEDVEGHESMHASISQLNVKKTPKSKDGDFRKAFAEKIERDQSALQQMLDKIDAQNAQREQAFHTAFQAQLIAAQTLPSSKPPNRASANPNADKPPSKEFVHPLWQAAVDVVDRAHNLQILYEQGCAVMKKHSPEADLGTAWDEGRKKLEEELNLGHKVIERQITKVFEPGNAAAPAEAVRIEDEQARMEDAKASAMFDLKLPQGFVSMGGPVSVADTLRYAESGMKRLSKGLPAVEENQA